jgi:DNA-binding transcriptional MerR regulator
VLEIGAVARELGVSPNTLRTWERRYGVVVPHRGEQGQRLYDPDQVGILRRVLALTRSGARAQSAHRTVAGAEPGRRLVLRIPPSVEAPLRARHAVDELIGSSSNARFAFNLRLVASELVSNAVRYGSGHQPIEIELVVSAGSCRLRVAGGDRLRVTRLRRRRQSAGRGLEIVDALATSWTIETGPRGTTVTVELASD